MNLPLSYGDYLRPESRRWLERAQQFRREHIDPVAADVDLRSLTDPHYHPEGVARAACDFGFYSMPIPKFAGGGGSSIADVAIVMEELCAGCAGLANIIGAHYLGLSGILFGLDLNHYDRFLRRVVEEERNGHPVIFSAAITEPTAGTDVEDAELITRAKLLTAATKVPGGYRLNGSKVFISNGSTAELNVVICAVDRKRPLETWSAFVVPSDTAGFSAARVELKMGQRACHAAQLTFEDCFIPEENRIGVEGRAMPLTEVVLAASRGPVAAIATGIARGALERTIAYCSRRKSGAGKLIDRQWVRIAIADMAAKIQLARNAYLQAADNFDQQVLGGLFGKKSVSEPLLMVTNPLRRSRLGLKVTGSETFKRGTGRWVLSRIEGPTKYALGLSSMAKFSCADAAVEVCLQALEILGADGADERFGVEKCLRDAKLTQIYEGTNQLNRLVWAEAFVEGIHA